MTGVAQVDPHPTEAFANAGYAVLFPMPRGGAGYGEAGQRMIVNESFKQPWENRASDVAHSPLTFADRVATPLLIQRGELDPRVPISGAWKFYRTLKTMGKTVEFDIYPRGGQVLREPAQRRAQMQRNFEWFTKWVR